MENEKMIKRLNELAQRLFIIEGVILKKKEPFLKKIKLPSFKKKEKAERTIACGFKSLLIQTREEGKYELFLLGTGNVSRKVSKVHLLRSEKELKEKIETAKEFYPKTWTRAITLVKTILKRELKEKPKKESKEEDEKWIDI